MSEQIWIELAGEEARAAAIGGQVWKFYVARCEDILGYPWPYIRERFDEIHRIRSAG